MNTKGLFYIPKTKEEIKKLVNDIVFRADDQSRLEMIYIVHLMNSFNEGEEND